MIQETNKYFIEVGSYWQNKYGNIVCGDSIYLHRNVKENRTVAVLSDGLGSGVKASVLSTMTASMALNFRLRREPIGRTVSIIMDTLPIDSVRNISYSTFTSVDVDMNGCASIVEYDNPPLIWIHNGEICSTNPKQTVVKNNNLHNSNTEDRIIKISEIELAQEDRLIFFSDGVTQSGIGNMNMPFGWEEGVKDFIMEHIKENPFISARELSQRIVKQSELNDILKPKDDTSCVVFYVRKPRKLLICTGPPFSDTKDKYLGEVVKNYEGKKIVCGGTTSKIISRELGKEITVDLNNIVSDLPPASQMEGVDLLTEGIITLGALNELIERGVPHNMSEGKGPAWDIFRMIMDVDIIDIVAGTKINVAHQDPSLPVELEIRRNVVKRLAYLMEDRLMKEVRIEFI
jgi:Serine phosphatase RsbU, regulator of sigma subunit